MAAITPAQYTQLVEKLAREHRVEMKQIENYTYSQLQQLWRILENARSHEEYALALRNGMRVIMTPTQTAAATLGAAHYIKSAQLYKASGHAPSNFKVHTPDTARFMRDAAPVIQERTNRSLGYTLSLLAEEKTDRFKMQNRVKGMTQQMLMNTSREIVNLTALDDRAVPVDEDDVTIEQRYGGARRPDYDDFHIDPRDLDDDGFVDLDDDEGDFEDAGDDDGYDSDYEEADYGDADDWDNEAWDEDMFDDEDTETVLDDIDRMNAPREYVTERAVHTSVRSEGCDFCKIVGLNKVPRDIWHDNCTCVHSPKFAKMSIEKLQSDQEAEDVYDQARERAEEIYGDKVGHLDMKMIMQEIRMIRYEQAQAEKAPEDRKAPRQRNREKNIIRHNHTSDQARGPRISGSSKLRRNRKQKR